jgi:hypothetical protein
MTEPRAIGRRTSVALWVVCGAWLAIGIFLLAAGGRNMAHQHDGRPVAAKVAHCELDFRYAVICTGSWVIGGDLTDGGHVVVGTIGGVGRGDVGKTVSARATGGSAHVPSYANPGAIAGLGLVMIALGCWFAARRVQVSRRATVV